MNRLLIAIISLVAVAGLIALLLHLVFRRKMLVKLWLGINPGLAMMAISVYLVGYLSDIPSLYKIPIGAVGALVFLVNLLVIARIGIKSLETNIGHVATSNDSLRDVARTIGYSSQGLASVVSEQAAGLEEVSATLEEMSTLTRDSAASARRAKEHASRAMTAVDTIRGVLDQLSEEMTRIQTSTDTSMRIVKTIDEIAFKTNILALNAAVEAARAGDSGRGFAVVAEEVRNLAKHSAEAAQSTSDNLRIVLTNIARGATMSVEARDTVHEVATMADKAVVEISAASDITHRQEGAIQEVSNVAMQLDRVTQEVSRSAEDNAGASEELATHVGLLDDVTTRLHQLIGSSRDAAPR